MIRDATSTGQRAGIHARIERQIVRDIKIIGSNFQSIFDRLGATRSGGSELPTRDQNEQLPGRAPPGFDPPRPGGRAEPGVLGIDALELCLASPVAVSPVLVLESSLREASGLREPGVGGPDSALLEQVVRRVAWGGDRRRGVARIELDGELSGTTIWVRGEGGEVALDIAFAPGQHPGDLPSRLLSRLRARGIEVSELEVR